jgi:hypothetical protein
MNAKIGFELEEILLALIIVLNILDFTELLGPFWDLIKKLLSWVTLGYLLYKADLYKIFFGYSNKKMNFAIIIAFFLMIVKNIIGFGKVAIKETGELGYGLVVNQNTLEIVEQCTSFSQCFYKFILDHAVTIETLAFYMGIILLFIVAAHHLIKHTEIKSPSILAAIGELGRPSHKNSKRLLRFILILVTFAAFFIVVFNLVMEWLAIAVDSTIATIVVFAYLLLFMKHYDKLGAGNLLFKMGNAVETFYEKFINLFKNKATILFAVSGMLVLHLLTDVANFIIPHIFVVRDAIYFEQLGASTHLPIFLLFLKQLPTITTLWGTLFLFILYLLNVVGLVLLLLIPAYFWYKAIRNEEVRLPRLLTAIFFSSFIVTILAPIFKIKQIVSENLVGVDIQTQQLSNYLPLVWIFVIVVGVFFSSWLLTRKLRKAKSYLAVALSLSFVAFYMFLYFVSMLPYYINSIISLTKNYKFILAIYFLVFLTITILFYVGGFIVLVCEVIKDVFYRE